MNRYLWFIVLFFKITTASCQNSWTALPFSFQEDSNHLKLGLINTQSMVIHPIKNNCRWLVLPKGGLYMSNNGGQNWTLCKGSQQLPLCELTCMVPDPVNEKIIYLGTNNHNNCGGLWKSINGGRTFVQLQNMQRPINAIVISQSNRHLLHLATSNGIYKTTNGGVTFSLVSGLGNQNFLVIKRIALANSHQLYATTSQGFYSSPDEGLTWINSISFSNNGFHSIGITKSDTNCVYLFNSANNGQVYSSFNRGLSFNVVKNTTLPALTGIDSYDTIYNSKNSGFILPLNSNSFYCGSKVIYNYISSTSFVSLNTYQQQLPRSINNLYTSDNGDTLFACTSGGLYTSNNNGQTWNYYMQGVNAIEGLALDVTNLNKKVLTLNNGVFSFNDSTIKSSFIYSIPTATNFIRDSVDTNLQFQAIGNLLYMKSWKDTSWINISNSLPTRCSISDLKIAYHVQPNCLYILFDGAGIYYTAIDSLRKIKARFTINNSIVCNGSNIELENNSSGRIDSVKWIFTGASIQQSVEYNPIVSILDRTNFSAQLIAYGLSYADTCFFSLQNNSSLNAIYELDSCNQFGSLFSESILHSHASTFQWQISNCDSTHTNAYAFPNYFVNTAGAEESLLSSIFSLPDSTNAVLRFDYAYTNYSQEYSDTLIIKAHLLCLDKEIVLFQKGASELRTTNDSLTISFVPTTNEWRSDSIDLSQCVGAGPMQLIITNKGHYGNNLYLDNLQIDSNYHPTSFRIAVNFFIEGYYAGNKQMRPALYISGISTNENETDSFRLKLLDKHNSAQLIYEAKGVVHIDGSSQVELPIAFSSDSYYLGLITRNGITVYTKAPVYLSRWGFQEWELRW
jgi:hypothetical protein